MISNSLLLENFRQVMGYHPFHFWGLSNAGTAKVNSSCNALLPKYAWQFGGADFAGREEIANAGREGHARLSNLLEYSALPDFYEETIQMPQYYDRQSMRSVYMGADGRWLTVQLRKGRILAAGPEKLTLIGEASITLQDRDNDGCFDTFIATIDTTVTDASRIAVYFTSIDRLFNEPASYRNRIEPVTVTFESGTATITGPAWLVVKPISYEGLSVNALDPENASVFVNAVAVYERWADQTGTTNTTAHALLEWHTQPWPSFCFVSPNSSDPAAVAYALARVSLINAKDGVVGVGEAVYDATNAQWVSNNFATGYRLPDSVTVRYLSGDSLRDWNPTIARLTAAEMGRRPCGCDMANRELYRWQLDLARAGSVAIEQFTISQGDLSNPVGTKAGHVYAWKQISTERRITGVLA